mmetsp:Transcript_14124/g.32223  ORF Transcript_14124/g.32223 Transcript_14124/m.32223 type:complete len:431 (-) Transcript_14124:297-1589(-)
MMASRSRRSRRYVRPRRQTSPSWWRSTRSTRQITTQAGSRRSCSSTRWSSRSLAARCSLRRSPRKSASIWTGCSSSCSCRPTCSTSRPTASGSPRGWLLRRGRWSVWEPSRPRWSRRARCAWATSSWRARSGDACAGCPMRAATWRRRRLPVPSSLSVSTACPLRATPSPSRPTSPRRGRSPRCASSCSARGARRLSLRRARLRTASLSSRDGRKASFPCSSSTWWSRRTCRAAQRRSAPPSRSLRCAMTSCGSRRACYARVRAPSRRRTSCWRPSPTRSSLVSIRRWRGQHWKRRRAPTSRSRSTASSTTCSTTSRRTWRRLSGRRPPNTWALSSGRRTCSRRSKLAPLARSRAAASSMDTFPPIATCASCAATRWSSKASWHRCALSRTRWSGSILLLSAAWPSTATRTWSLTTASRRTRCKSESRRT